MFRDRVVVVTGAARGIGAAVAEAFAARGARVWLFDVLAEPAREVARAIRERHAGATAQAETVDVAAEDEVASGVARVLAREGRVDVLVNNAGVEDPAGHAVHELEPVLWDRVVDVNLKGAFLMTRAVLPAMLREGRGSIVNVASSLGMEAQAGKAAYCAAKAGLLMLTRVTALEYGSRGIRANAVCPGAILDTPMHQEELELAPDRAELERFFSAARPMNRHGFVREVVPAILFLAGDESSFITGACLAVDGGRTAGMSPHLTAPPGPREDG